MVLLDVRTCAVRVSIGAVRTPRILCAPGYLVGPKAAAAPDAVLLEPRQRVRQRRVAAQRGGRVPWVQGVGRRVWWPAVVRSPEGWALHERELVHLARHCAQSAAGAHASGNCAHRPGNAWPEGALSGLPPAAHRTPGAGGIGTPPRRRAARAPSQQRPPACRARQRACGVHGRAAAFAAILNVCVAVPKGYGNCGYP